MEWTPYQLRIIEALKAGEVLHYMSGMNSHWFIGNIKPRPTQKTAEKLIREKIVVLIKSDWRGSSWKLA